MSAIKDNKPVIQTRSHKVGGDNVVQFPHNKPEIKRTRLETQLRKQQKLLRFHFKLIKEAQEQLANLNLQCCKAEEQYDEMLIEYSDRIGLENVDKIYMDYSSHVKPVVTDDGIGLAFDE